jgi:hypothetical protein
LAIRVTVRGAVPGLASSSALATVVHSAFGDVENETVDGVPASRTHRDVGGGKLLAPGAVGPPEQAIAQGNTAIHKQWRSIERMETSLEPRVCAAASIPPGDPSTRAVRTRTRHDRECHPFG